MSSFKLRLKTIIKLFYFILEPWEVEHQTVSIADCRYVGGKRT